MNFYLKLNLFKVLRAEKMWNYETSPPLQWTNRQWKKLWTGVFDGQDQVHPVAKMFSSTSLWHLNNCFMVEKAPAMARFKRLIEFNCGFLTRRAPSFHTGVSWFNPRANYPRALVFRCDLWKNKSSPANWLKAPTLGLPFIQLLACSKWFLFSI